MKKVQRAERKMKTTKRVLERPDTPEESREVTPLAPNLEEGTITTQSFHSRGDL